MKQLFSFLVSIATLLSVNAAPKSFTVQAPNWSKVAVCDTEGGINIRKSPSTSAPRYVSRCDDPEEYWNITNLWSSTPIKKNEQIITFNGTAPIVSEHNGWYELYGIGPQGENGWVSAKFCEVEQPRALKPGQNNTIDFVWLSSSAEGGNYAIYCKYEEMDGFSTFYIGRESNGILVCPYIYCSNANYDPNTTPGAKIIHRNDNGEEWTISTFTYGEKETTRMGFDLSKFSTKALESIVECAEKLDEPVYVYRMNGEYHHN